MNLNIIFELIFFYSNKNNENNIIKFDIMIKFDNLKILFFYSLKI